MKNITRHTGVITNIKRLPSSVNGNPRYSFQCDGHTIKTAVDSMHGYAITNYENKEVTITVGTHYGSLTLNTIKETQ
jgi:hypothetical protein